MMTGEALEPHANLTLYPNPLGRKTIPAHFAFLEAIPSDVLNYLVASEIAGICDGCSKLRLWADLQDANCGDHPGESALIGFSICRQCSDE